MLIKNILKLGAISLGLIFIGTNLVFAANLNDAFRVDTSDVYSNSDRLDSASINAHYNILGGSAATTPEIIISTSLSVLLSLLGVIFLALTVYGGFLWMTASGNQEQLDKAKRVINESLLGLAIVVSAYAISYLLISVFMPAKIGV